MKKGKKKQHKTIARAEIKHRAVLKNISDNIRKGKKISRGKAMRDAGYSKSYSESSHIKDTRTWSTLLIEELPETYLMDRLNVLLKAKQVQRFIFENRVKNDEIIEAVEEAGFKVITIRPSPMGKMAFYSTENTKAVHDGLTHAFKLLGKYEPEQINITRRRFQGLSNEELMARKKAAKDFLLKKK